MFKGRKIIIATMHAKDKVIAPLLEKNIGAICIVSSEINTDILGTFSGEIERENDPIVTLRNKCLLAMKLSDCDLAVGTEGSFGMHPSIFFAPANDELIMLLDKKNNIEIVVRELSTETNFNSAQISTMTELISFADSVGFPSHGLILRKSKTENINIIKGVCDWKELKLIFEKFVNQYGEVCVETDMRALYNPSRMSIIESATIKLIDKIKSLCPNCSFPGFSVTSVKKGLPCEYCHFPTQSNLSHICSCSKCGFSNAVLYPNNKSFEEPMYCDFCNP